MTTSYELMKQVEDILEDEEIGYRIMNGGMFMIPVEMDDMEIVHAIIAGEDAIIQITSRVDRDCDIDDAMINKANSSMLFGSYGMIDDALVFRSSYMVSSRVSRRHLLKHLELGIEAIMDYCNVCEAPHPKPDRRGADDEEQEHVSSADLGASMMYF